MSGSRDVVVIGAGHNGLACAAYLARAGLSVLVLEGSDTVGGCVYTIDLPDGRGRLELGSYEHGGIRASGVADDLELESRHGLEFHLRDEVTLGPCDDGSAIAFHSSLEETIALLTPVVGSGEAARYRAFASFAAAGAGLLHQVEGGPPPSLRELAALAEGALGATGARLIQTFLAPASTVLRGALDDERLHGVLAHWAAHSQQSPADPGTGAGALLLAGGHGSPAARPKGGARSTVEALARCVRAAGGEVRTSCPATAVEMRGDRAVAVVAGDERFEARTIVSAIDARRLFLGLMAGADLPADLVAEVRRIHVGARNVSELKVDAVIEGLPPVRPAGFERSFMLSPNTTTDLERAFAAIALGELAERPPLMIAFPSVLEDGWAPPGRHVAWVSTFVPWRLASGPWDEAALERAADATWRAVERAFGGEPIAVAERRVTGPPQWVARHGNPHANPNHVEMSIDQLLALRPSPSLSRYRTPVGGLYLTGAGTHPGGGVTGVPGRNAAAVVLRDLGLARRRGPGQARARIAMLRDAARAARALRGAA